MRETQTTTKTPSFKEVAQDLYANDPDFRDSTRDFLIGLASLGAYFHSKKKLRKLGAPEWVCYAVPGISLSLARISLQLERANEMRRQDRKNNAPRIEYTRL